MAELAQAYIHLSPYSITVEELRELGASTDRLAESAARANYDKPVEIIVDIEIGSLWTRVTVVGGLLIGTLHLLGEYKDIKESTHMLCNDAREFGVNVCGAFTTTAGVTAGQVFRTEKRLKTPGRLERFIQKFEELDEQSDGLAEAELRERVHDLDRRLKRIMSDLNEEEATILLRQLGVEAKRRRTKFPIGRDVEIPRVAKVEEGDDLLESLDPEYFAKVHGLSTARTHSLLHFDEQGKLSSRLKPRYHHRFEVKPPR